MVYGMWTINWEKVSELVFEALLTGLITALTILISYSLGKRQADTNWKKEIARREKELKEQNLKDLTNKQIDILKQLIRLRFMCEYRATYDNFHHGKYFLNGDEIHEILLIVTIAQGLFPITENDNFFIALINLAKMTSWDFKLPDTEDKAVEEAEFRISYVRSIFDAFNTKLLELERMLIPK
jgi:hypothetical protein